MDAICEVFKAVDPSDPNTASSAPPERLNSQTRASEPWYDGPAMAFARWDPIRDLLAIQQHLERFAPSQAGWKPPVDLQEAADRYVVTAELPGVKQEDIHVAFNGGVLTLSGLRREREREEPCEQFHRVERGHGTFNRSFHLPAPVDPEGITADLRDGVLTVTCPKLTDSTAHRIHIT
jgi:HSP20 family protein